MDEKRCCEIERKNAKEADKENMTELIKKSAICWESRI